MVYLTSISQGTLRDVKVGMRVRYPEAETEAGVMELCYKGTKSGGALGGKIPAPEA